MPQVYLDRGRALGIIGLKDFACEDFEKYLSIEDLFNIQIEVYELMRNFSCSNNNKPNSNSKKTKEIKKFKIVEGEYANKKPDGKYTDFFAIEELPSLMVVENGQRIILYGNEKQVLDIIKLLPKEKFEADQTIFQPFIAIDNNGNEMRHDFVNQSGQTWLYLSYPEVMLFYHYTEF